MTIQRISDFTIWDLQDEFTTKEAAYLWLGLEPNHNIGWHSGTVLSLINTLVSAINNQELSARRGDPRLWEDTHIKRDSLRAWAHRKGQHPPFLFPEYRTLPPKPELPDISPSDAALGKKQRELLQKFAESNQDRHNARQAEWLRWNTEGRRIQASRTRKCSTNELAKLVKKSLNLPDAVSTIRQGLGKAEKLTCQN